MLPSGKAPLDVQARLHQAAYAAHQPQSVYALLDLQPAAPTARLPVDLRLVLDNSGSMSDVAVKQGKKGVSKLALLSQAVCGMLEALALGDSVTLVRFDHEAETLFAGRLRSEADRARAIAAVKRLTAMGGTSLIAGLEEALDAPPLPDHVARVVLVTDGEVERGEEAACERLAFDQRGQQTWLVYGIGVAYNDAFLDRLGKANGGQYVHLAGLQQAVDQFAAEVAVMGEIALAQLVLSVEAEPGVSLLRADRIVPQTEALPVHMPQFFSADLGDVDRARGQKVLLQLQVPALAPGQQAVARVRCGYHVPALKLLNQQVELPLVLEVAAEAGALDGEVLRTARLAGAGRLYTLGLAEATQGDADAAVRTLGSAAGLYDQLGLPAMSQQLTTLTTTMRASGGLDEEVKRTLTTMARQSWQQP